MYESALVWHDRFYFIKSCTEMRIDMELVTKNVHLNKQKGKVVTQITLENDFNVSDQKPDVDDIITDNHYIKVDTLKILNGKAEITGRLSVQALYVSHDDSQPVWEMEMEIPFMEPVNMDMLIDGDTVRADYEIDNVKVSVINSRKISVKAVVTFTLEAESIYDMEIAVEPEDTEKAEYMKKQLKIMQIVMKKRDVFRIKEEVDVSGGKPNIKNILWRNIGIRNCQTKLMEDKVSLSGELVLFIIYLPEEENMPVQWIDSVINFNGIIDAEGCNEEMIHDINVNLAEMNVDIKPDYDGEQRIFEVDAVLNLDMRIFEEDSIDVLDDVYSPSVDLIPDRRIASGESLVMKNMSKCRVSEKVGVDAQKGRILQICNTFGKVCIDNIVPSEDGINIDGAVEVKILYISGNDDMPFCSSEAVIPFSHKADIKGMNMDMEYSIKNSLEQLSSIMTSENEVEVKAVISMDITVMNKVDESVITAVNEQEIDINKIKDMPGIIIYNVKKGDSLWSIAKRFHTSVDSLKSINGISGDGSSMKSGESLLVIKSV